MNPIDRPSPNPEVMLREGFDDYPLLFQPLFADVVGLCPVGLAIWRALNGRRTPAEVAAVVRSQFDGAPETIDEDVRAFLSDLERRGFITTTRTDASPHSPNSLPVDNPTTGILDSPPVQEDRFSGHALTLADGNRFILRAGNVEAARVVDQFAVSARLSSVTGAPSDHSILVVTEDYATSVDVNADAVCLIQSISASRAPRREGGRGSFAVKPVSETEWLWQQLVRLSAFIGSKAQARGGVLLHSALASYPPLSPHSRHPTGPGFQQGMGREWGEERGALLAGRSGVGKSTATTRLPPPWRALSDDMTLLARDNKGTYWAHPWPTWSRLFNEQSGDRWDVQNAVPLHAIFILDQAVQDRAVPAGGGEAVSLLMELARQSARHLWKNTDQDILRLFHTQRFDNLCALVQAVPTYLLDVSLEGSFWEEMEKVLQYPPML